MPVGRPQGPRPPPHVHLPHRAGQAEVSVQGEAQGQGRVRQLRGEGSRRAVTVGQSGGGEHSGIDYVLSWLQVLMHDFFSVDLGNKIFFSSMCL